jgi:hypothetical protein
MGQIVVVLASFAVGVAIFEIGLRLDPTRMGQLLILAQADFYPYLGVANLFPHSIVPRTFRCSRQPSTIRLST